MDASYSFPRHHAPIPRPPVATSSSSAQSPADPANRQSNALRASVLDAALLLGVGTNSTVANWMFNNSLEEEEETSQPSPNPTNNSPHHSEESSSSSAPYPHTPSSSTQSSPYVNNHGHLQVYGNGAYIESHKAEMPETNYEAMIDFDASQVTVKPTFGEAENSIAFPGATIPPRPATPAGSAKKLKKKRGDGNESDGGYLSEAASKKKDKARLKEKEREKGDAESEKDKKEAVKEAKARAKEEKLNEKIEKAQEKKEKEEERKRKKSLVSSIKTSKKRGDKEKESGYATGYETDAAASSSTKAKAKPKKAKSKPSTDAGAGYETDAGYLSSTPAKAKKRFFGLGSKASKADLKHQEDVFANLGSPPIREQEKEVVPLPIASRFATTAGPPSATSPAPSATSATAPGFGSGIASSQAPPLPLIHTGSSSSFSIISPVDNRESYTSAESASSSGSNNPKRRAFHFGRNHTKEIRENESQHSNHAAGSGSFSTITSASHNYNNHPTSSSPPKSTSPTAKFPVISYPVTRGQSPPPLHPDHAPKLKHVPDSLSLSPHPPPNQPQYAWSNPGTRAPSPSPSGFLPGSPYVMLTPINTSLPASPRPNQPPTDGFGPRTSPTVSKSSPWTSPGLDVGGKHRVKPSQLSIVPSSDYLVPSPRGTPLPSPNVLAYYDIPPPSPPPAGPLPSVPGNAGGFPGASSRRNQEQGGLYSQPLPNIQRGRESPFPARPVLPNGANHGGASVGTGLEARVRVRRYRDLYAIDSPPGGWNGARPGQRRSDGGMLDINVVEPTEDGWGYGDEGDEEEEEDMRDVLDRFAETRLGTSSGREETGQALGRMRSYEQLKGRPSVDEDDDRSRYPDDERTVGNRNSRWSGSIYSRASFLDPDKSEEARERFLERVEAMYDENGRERVGNTRVIPPVPKLPDGIATGPPPHGKAWNRF